MDIKVLNHFDPARRVVPTSERGNTPKGNEYTCAYHVVDGVIVGAVAHCSPHDAFSRKVGRQIAEARLRSVVNNLEKGLENHPNLFFLIEAPAGATPTDVQNTVHKHICSINQQLQV